MRFKNNTYQTGNYATGSPNSSSPSSRTMIQRMRAAQAQMRLKYTHGKKPPSQSHVHFLVILCFREFKFQLARIRLLVSS